MHLHWADVRYGVKRRQDILRGVSGDAWPGELLAIMGPSGSGKTSLVKMLVGELRPTGGTVEIQGVARSPWSRRVRSRIGYVRQHVELLGSLTVWETLWYVALLRLSASRSRAAIRTRVSELLTELDLDRVRDMRVGNHDRISGGERRRLTVAQQLVHAPSLLILDEPTSGLDSSSARQVVLNLQARARRGTTVICTIHQPRSSVLRLFGQVYILTRGATVYSGPQGRLVAYLQSLGHTCPQYENPADFALDIIRGHEESLLTQFVEVPRSRPQSQMRQSHTVQAQQPQQQFASAAQGATWAQQVAICMLRTLKYKAKEPMAYATYCVSCVVIPLIIGSIYWDIGTSQSEAQDRLAAISFMVLLMAFMAADQMLLIPIERRVYLADRSSGIVTTSSFYLGRSLAELPGHIGFPVVAATISYTMLGFRWDVQDYVGWVAILACTTLAGSGFLMAVGSVCKNFEMSNSLGMSLMVLFMLFDGFYVNPGNIPVYYRWIQKIAFLSPAVHGGATLGFVGLEFNCTEAEAAIGCIRSGEAFLDRAGIEETDAHVAVLKLLGLSLAYRTVAFFGLKYCWTDI